RFYVRNHFALPRLEARTWRLRVEGAVNRQLDLTYDQLRALAPRDVTATLECAGNSRALTVPPLRGVAWQQGAVGNAAWAGVPLAAVLDRAGLRDNAVEVVLEGADRGEVTAEPRPHGPISFARSLPLAKARGDVLLAFRMNGADLPPAHGFPLRAVVPGWYGMASVKWLTRIVVTEDLFQGYYQTVDYAYWQQGQAGPELIPLSRMQVKAEIARPGINEVVASNDNYPIRGAAWTSGREIAKVEVTTNDGACWNEAKLIGDAGRDVWRLWEFDWKTPHAPGRYTLMARATDSLGHTQPDHRDANRGTYMVNHCLPIEIEVR